MFKKKGCNKNIYGDRNYSLTLETKDYVKFNIPKFDEGDIQNRIEKRTEELRKKIADGEFDSANVDLLCTAYINLIQQMQAEINAWKTQSEIAIKEFATNMEKQYKSRSEALSSAAAEIEKYKALTPDK